MQPPPPPPSSYLPPPPEPAKKDGCGGAGKWIACGCAVLIAGTIAFVIGVFSLAMFAIRSTDIYTTALDRARKDPRVIEALGEPIGTRFIPSGNVNVKNRTGDADITIPVRGPKGEASIHAVATRQNERWTYTMLVVTLENGQTIDLLTPSSPESTDTAPRDA